MLNLALAILIFIACAILIGIIGILGLWMKGADIIALPGLGILVSTPLICIVLIILEIIAAMLAAYLVRYIPIVGELLE